MQKFKNMHDFIQLYEIYKKYSKISKIFYI